MYPQEPLCGVLGVDDVEGEEMKYIELDKAIEAVNGAFKFEVEKAENYRDIAVETLKLLPSVKVVRCRECVMWDDSFVVNGKKKCLNIGVWTDRDFYCGWGSKE